MSTWKKLIVILPFLWLPLWTSSLSFSLSSSLSICPASSFKLYGLLICCVSSAILQANPFSDRLPPDLCSQHVLQLQVDKFLKSNSCTCQKFACIMGQHSRDTSWWCRTDCATQIDCLSSVSNSISISVFVSVSVSVCVALMICNLWISVAAKGYQSASSDWAILSDRETKRDCNCLPTASSSSSSSAVASAMQTKLCSSCCHYFWLETRFVSVRFGSVRVSWKTLLP